MGTQTEENLYQGTNIKAPHLFDEPEDQQKERRKEQADAKRVEPKLKEIQDTLQRLIDHHDSVDVIDLSYETQTEAFKIAMIAAKQTKANLLLAKQEVDTIIAEAQER